MTSRILQEDDGLILTEADEPIGNNLDVGASRILQQDDGLILTQNNEAIINDNYVGNFLPNNITTAAPVVQNTSITQVHSIGVTGITTGQPVVANAAMTQVHGISCTSILTGAVVVSTATIAQEHDLDADLILTGAVVVANTAIAQVHNLSSVSILTGPPVVPDVILFGEIDVSSILTGPPVVSPTPITVNSVLSPSNILTGRPDVETAPDPNAQYEEVVQQMFGGWPKRIYDHTDLAISRGHAQGYRTLYKFGYNPDVDGTEETVWGQGGNYPWFAGELTVFVSSSSANDSGTGTGARTILIQGLDENYAEVEETITLNGQAQITSQLSYLRIYRAFVTLAGSGGSAAGTIYIGSSGATGGVPNTSTYASLSLGNQTQIAAYTVPAGHTLYVDEINFTAAVSQANKLVTCKFVSREFGSNVFRTRFIQVLQSNQLIQTFKYPQAFAEKTDLECRASTDTTNTALGASFQGVLIKNDT